MERPLIVGAGLSGAVLARVLAEGGTPSLVIDERTHIAGNCHTDIDEETGIVELDMTIKNTADETRVFGTARVKLPTE